LEPCTRGVELRALGGELIGCRLQRVRFVEDQLRLLDQRCELEATGLIVRVPGGLRCRERQSEGTRQQALDCFEADHLRSTLEETTPQHLASIGGALQDAKRDAALGDSDAIIAPSRRNPQPRMPTVDASSRDSRSAAARLTAMLEE
jgi:hypothetical protein